MAITLDAGTVRQVERLLPREAARMPLADAVSRRLGVESWMLTLGEDGTLRAVTVLAPANVVVPSGPDLHAAVEVAPLDRRFPLPRTGALAHLLADTSATGAQLVDLALRGDDPEIRTEAVRVGLDEILDDPALERSVLTGLAKVDDAALAAALTGVAGQASGALLSLVAERARGRPLGERARRVLTHLGR
jgi:hypothetical protein